MRRSLYQFGRLGSRLGIKVDRGGSVSEFRKVPVLDGTTLRRGGSTKSDPSNIIGQPRSLRKGDYTAFVQCAGQEVGDQDEPHNNWWVLIDTPLGRGWVSATRIDEDGNDERIEGVNTAATVFEVEVPTGHHRRLPIVPGGGRVRSGGCTKGDPDNVIGSVGGRDIVTALVQCAGEEVGDRNEPHNFWWVLIETGENSVGWVSAVLIDEGGNDQPIDNVPTAPTVFALPPDLI
jgi:hypothetical protein